jgi:hypothetical protein
VRTDQLRRRSGDIQQENPSGDSCMARLCRAISRAKLPANASPDRVLPRYASTPLNAAVLHLGMSGVSEVIKR